MTIDILIWSRHFSTCGSQENRYRISKDSLSRHRQGVAEVVCSVDRAGLLLTLLSMVDLRQGLGRDNFARDISDKSTILYITELFSFVATKLRLEIATRSMSTKMMESWKQKVSHKVHLLERRLGLYESIVTSCAKRVDHFGHLLRTRYKRLL